MSVNHFILASDLAEMNSADFGHQRRPNFTDFCHMGLDQLHLLTNILLFFTVLLCCSTAYAQFENSRQREILLQVLNADGWVDESTHQEFWELIPLEIRHDDDAIASLRVELEQAFIVAARFQRSVWMSAQKSLKAQKIIREASYEEVKQEIVNLMNRVEQKDQFYLAIRNADEILRAAAFGTPIDVNGTRRYITEDLIEVVLSGIEGSLHRFDRLINPNWTTEESEYVFDDAHVRILWRGPFRKQVDQVAGETGGVATVISLSHQLGETDAVGLNFVRTSTHWADPTASAINAVSSSLRAFGMSETDVAASQWRSRIAAEGVGSTDTSSGMIFASTRIVEAAEFDGFWQILAVSGTSKLDAMRLRDEFESSIQLVAGSP